MADQGLPENGAPSLRRAVRDALRHGLRGDLAASAVGLELGQHLQSAVTADVGDGADVSAIVGTLREECGEDVLSYARLLELLVVASVDELQVIAGPPGDIAPRRDDLHPVPSRPLRRRRR